MEKYDKLPIFYKNYKAKENETLYEHTVNLLENLEELSKIINLEYQDLIEKACIYHDLGKINPLFQKRLENKKKFDDTKEIGHNIISTYLAKKFLANYDSNDRNIILYAILNHHNYVDNFETISEKKELLQENLKKIALEIFNDSQADFFKDIGARELSKIGDLRSRANKKSILVKGFLHKCDYAASAYSKVEIPNVHLKNRLEILKEKFKNNGKSNDWNDMQKFAKLNSCSNMILIGSTGLGKTEASLLWIGDDKGFYVLPLKTAINAMYKRIKYDLFPQDFESNLGLLHGELENIYLENSQSINTSEENEESMKFWKYYSLTRNMSLPLTISTPDQIFRFAFRYSSYELQLATYSYSKIVIDEIQAYSPDILATLIYSLKMIDMVGGKFAITTATLPPFIKDLLQNGHENPIKYVEKVFLNDKIRHKVKLNHRSIDIDEIKNFIEEKYDQESMKILIVLNKVKVAQDTYRSLKTWILENDLDIEINLLHSKFTVQDRNEKEDMILKDGDTSCQKKVIWISTQVVEASLDIDFDYLFTELSDVSALLQRLGRCNRKGLKSTNEFNCFVYTELNDGLFKVFTTKNANSRKGIIFKSLFELSKSALLEWENQNKDGRMSEKDKNDMIDKYFTMEKIKEYDELYGSNYIAYLSEYNKMYNHLENIMPDTKKQSEVIKEFRNIISVRVIPMSIYEDKQQNIIEIIDEIEEKRKLIGKKADKEEKQKLRIDILRLKDKFKQFTLNISLYELGPYRGICVVDNEKIIISNLKYSKEYGLLREKEEDTGGIFI